MKKLMTLILAAGLFFAGTAPAQAIDFKAEGEWLFGFAGGDGSLINKYNNGAGKQQAHNNDKFSAMQRIRLQLEAIASESLSGTVMFEIGDSTWGKSGDDSGAALGADGKIIGVMSAYIDWMVPQTDLKVRMGLQPIEVPNVAGGSSVLSTDAMTAVALNYQFNDNVGVSFFWGRPYNDNYTSVDGTHSNDKTNYLDNMDLFMLSVPLTFEGIEITPWVMYGVLGQNTMRAEEGPGELSGLLNGVFAVGDFDRRHANSSLFWAGLPIKLSLWDPLNIEFDINYGYMESVGRGWITHSNGYDKRFDTESEGWLVKALIEYKMDWGTPGIFGWYASGDDSNPKNGSERMPSVEAKGNFTSFMGDGNFGWSSDGTFYDRQLNYAGTWGVGLQLADMSFIENLSHTFRVAYWGGTNSPSMAKYANSSYSWGYAENEAGNGLEQGTLYMTTNDGLLEFNLVNSYQMYENFEVNLELGYMVNFFDEDTWKKANNRSAYEKQDAWKAQLVFAYTF